MREGEALLKAIVANPDEDTPRLAYADWLDENRPDRRPTPATAPSARAEFIRVQCRLANTTPDEPDYVELLDRQYELATWLDAFAPEKRGLRGLKSEDHRYADYVRGFATHASGELAETDKRAVAKLCNDLQKVTARTTVRALRLYSSTARQMAEAVANPAVEVLRALSLESTHPSGCFSELVATDSAASWCPQADDENAELVARAMAESPHVRNLRDLQLGFNLTDDAAAILAGAKNLDRLAALTVSLPAATPNAIRALARADWFRNLNELTITWKPGDEMLAALAALPPLPKLYRLNL
jgi:uncharacterized protein (TIGR02996 family)